MTAPFGSDSLPELTEFAQWFLFGAHGEPYYQPPTSAQSSENMGESEMAA